MSVAVEFMMVHCPARHEETATIDVSDQEPWKSILQKRQYPDFSLTWHDQALVAKVSNPKLLDADSLDSFRSTLINLDSDCQPQKLVIDFTETLMLSSSALGILMELYRRMNGQGRTLSVCGLSPEMVQVFELTQLTRCIPVFPTDHEALRG